MRGRRLRLTIAVAAALVATLLLPRATSADTAPQVGHRLRATRGEAARIVDNLGRTVILRGVNVNGLGEYYQEFADLPSTLPLTNEDFAEMASLGFNVVRLIVSWSRLEPSPGQIDYTYIEQIAETIELARAHDIYVLLDMHQDAWGPHVFTPDGVTCPPGTDRAVGWDGAPMWATALVGTVATCRLAIREASLTVATSFENFYLDVGNVQTHLIKTWAALARRFAADPAVAGYDLLNEPNPGLVIGVNDYTLLGVFYRRALAAIRSAESTGGGFSHIGFFEPAVITGPLPLSAPLPAFSADRNLVYAPHLYNESISPLPFSIEDGFRSAATAASLHGTTFFSGEWGWFGDPATDQAKMERYAAAEDAHLVGGTWWQWEQACGDPHAVGVRGNRPGCAGRSPYSDGLVTRPRSNTMVLDRAYPRAVPGQLQGIDADVTTGSLTVRGRASAAEAAAPADLWIPKRCSDPVVSGTNVSGASTRSVPGGFRVSTTIGEAGPYELTVRCGASG